MSLKTSWPLRFNACLLHTSHTIAVSNASISIVSKHRSKPNGNETLAYHRVLFWNTVPCMPAVTTQPTPFQAQAKWHGTLWIVMVCDVNIPMCSTKLLRFSSDHQSGLRIVLLWVMLEVWRAVGLSMIYQPKSLRKSSLSPQASNAAVGPAGVLGHLYSFADFCREGEEKIEYDRTW